jgi:hypothetical protein
MKTAVIVAGVCRFTEISHTSWNIFPDADWYLSTWDITQNPYSPLARSSIKEINAIRHKFKHIEISNYKKEYLEKSIEPAMRPFILLEKILKITKDKQYKRVIYFRPDLVLFKMNKTTWPNLTQMTLNDFNESDFDIDDSTIMVTDCYGPDNWVSHERRQLQDSFMLFSWNSFAKFVENAIPITSHYDIHVSYYEFFERNNIVMKPLLSISPVILRNNIVNNLNKTFWNELTELFNEEYSQNDHLGKFTKQIELKEL